MTPRSLDTDLIAVRLRMMRELVDQLGALAEVDAPKLEAEPVTRAAVERFVQSIVDLAVDINSHVAAARLGEAPTTGRSSFELVGRTGAIDVELAERLAPAASLRNILVHRYTDIDVKLVAAAVPTVLEGFDVFIKQVASFARSVADRAQ